MESSRQGTHKKKTSIEFASWYVLIAFGMERRTRMTKSKSRLGKIQLMALFHHHFQRPLGRMQLLSTSGHLHFYWYHSTSRWNAFCQIKIETVNQSRTTWLNTCTPHDLLSILSNASSVPFYPLLLPFNSKDNMQQKFETFPVFLYSSAL